MKAQDQKLTDMKFSAKKYSVRIKDILKGLLMAVGTAVGTMAQKISDQGLNGGLPPQQWKIVAMAAIAAAVTYIVRKFLIDDVKQAEKTIEQSK